MAMENDKIEVNEAELICQNCPGIWDQHEYVREQPRLFGLKFFIRWFFRCRTCGYTSKVYCNKRKNVK